MLVAWKGHGYLELKIGIQIYWKGLSGKLHLNIERKKQRRTHNKRNELFKGIPDEIEGGLKRGIDL
jgi:hypothetical protein